jgi:hypothetical protein
MILLDETAKLWVIMTCFNEVSPENKLKDNSDQYDVIGQVDCSRPSTIRYDCDVLVFAAHE